MGYQAALDKAWAELKKASDQKIISVRMISDEYQVDTQSQKVLSSSCNVPAKEYITILILHYLIGRAKGLPQATGDWISFRELAGGTGYYEAFRKRALAPIIRKFGANPQELVSCLDRFPGKRVQFGDYGIVLDIFDGVAVMITVFGQDEEFSAEANIFFDSAIKEIFCTEDIVVLSGFVAAIIR